MTKFDPASWTTAAGQVDDVSQEFQRACDPALDPPTLPWLTLSPIDRQLKAKLDPVATKWYHLIGGASAKMGSDASKMRATAKNYGRVEDTNEEIAGRYWTRG